MKQKNKKRCPTTALLIQFKDQINLSLHSNGIQVDAFLDSLISRHPAFRFYLVNEFVCIDKSRVWICRATSFTFFCCFSNVCLLGGRREWNNIINLLFWNSSLGSRDQGLELAKYGRIDAGIGNGKWAISIKFEWKATCRKFRYQNIFLEQPIDNFVSHSQTNK